MACICAVPITLVENIFEAVFFMWLVLFFGGAILPSCSGILVSIVPRRLRPLASALCIVVINLFGYFLSLVLTGLLMDVS